MNGDAARQAERERALAGDPKAQDRFRRLSNAMHKVAELDPPKVSWVDFGQLVGASRKDVNSWKTYLHMAKRWSVFPIPSYTFDALGIRVEPSAPSLTPSIGSDDTASLNDASSGRFKDEGWVQTFTTLASHPGMTSGNNGKYLQLYAQSKNEALLYHPAWSTYPLHLKDLDSLSNQAFVDSVRGILSVAPPVVDNRGFWRFKVLDWEAFTAVVLALADSRQSTALPEQVDLLVTPVAGSSKVPEECVQRMVSTAFATAARSGQQVLSTSTAKEKYVLLSRNELFERVRVLLANGSGRCALTGIKLDLKQRPDHKDYWPSLDRIDSNGHYELENLQVVCRFVNYWKSARKNDDFKGLLEAVRKHRP